MESRAVTNKENAQHSTGPKTESGKQRSSLNALRHGLTGQLVVMPNEDQAAYEAHLESFQAEYAPQGATETNLVQSLADTSWRLNRVAILETKLLNLSSSGNPIVDALGLAPTLASQCKSLANLSMHSQRLSRQFERAVNQLRDLQRIRRTQESDDLHDLLAIMETHEKAGESYDPADDGFVFSTAEIAQAKLLRNRYRQAQKAAA